MLRKDNFYEKDYIQYIIHQDEVMITRYIHSSFIDEIDIPSTIEAISTINIIQHDSIKFLEDFIKSNINNTDDLYKLLRIESIKPSEYDKIIDNYLNINKEN